MRGQINPLTIVFEVAKKCKLCEQQWATGKLLWSTKRTPNGVACTKGTKWKVYNEFLTQFAFNVDIDVSIRELETTKQKLDDTISSFFLVFGGQRWTIWQIRLSKIILTYFFETSNQGLLDTSWVFFSKILGAQFRLTSVLRKALLEVCGQTLLLPQKIREGSLLDHPRGLERLAPLIINIRGTLIIHIIGHPQLKPAFFLHSANTSQPICNNL